MNTNIMDTIIDIVKMIATFQLLIIILFVALIYICKIIFYYRDRIKIQKQARVTRRLNSLVSKKVIFSDSVVKYLRGSIFFVLHSLPELDKSPAQKDNFNAIKRELSDRVLIPKAKKLAFSRSWFKRYCATRCYFYGFDTADEKILLKLMKDKILLVSVNAAIAAVKYFNPYLINSMIDIFSGSKHLQQSVYAEIITKDSPDISEIVLDRLNIDNDLHIKIFCYNLLLALPSQKTILKVTKSDANSTCLDLQIAAIKYIAHTEDGIKMDIVSQYAVDSHWEVRAIVAKIFGDFPNRKYLPFLTGMLRDPQWWVRVNAAHALMLHGDEGVMVLKSQSPIVDPFAYEIAQEALQQQYYTRGQTK